MPYAFSSSDSERRWARTKVHFGVIALATFFVLSLLAQNIRFHELNRELQELESEKTRLEEERTRLNLAYEKFRSPARIRALAGTSGMVTPVSSSIHNLEPITTLEPTEP